MEFASILALVFVALFWGVTNPFIKYGSKGLEDVTDQYKDMPWYKRQLASTWWLATRWQYVVPLALNLSGSVLYYKTLGDSDLSVVVPITNSLTLAITLIVGALLGENVGSTSTILGVCMVFAGVTLCTMSSMG
ncbi:hypothetical protein BC832DRAFT_545609 [Gaertneriomyces semiglobifer]|nr:hypothetical protein BC832DRAFT_545609 [Gaertneriomyces semiglobifer]